MAYIGDWTVSTAYVVGDSVTDVNGDSGLEAGSLIHCTTSHTSDAGDLSIDWIKGFWSTNSGTNNYYNNSIVDGGPKLVEGTLATATGVEKNLFIDIITNSYLFI